MGLTLDGESYGSGHSLRYEARVLSAFNAVFYASDVLICAFVEWIFQLSV